MSVPDVVEQISEGFDVTPDASSAGVFSLGLVMGLFLI
jgi:hypothetical protein